MRTARCHAPAAGPRRERGWVGLVVILVISIATRLTARRALGLLAGRFNVVLMGMGEPLHNYDETMKALRILADPDGLAVSPRRVTLSTVGIVPALDRLASEAVGEVAGTSVDHTDGVKVVWPDGWVHVRASNTESLIRIIAEADDARRAGELADWARDRLRW